MRKVRCGIGGDRSAKKQKATAVAEPAEMRSQNERLLLAFTNKFSTPVSLDTAYSFESITADNWYVTVYFLERASHRPETIKKFEPPRKNIR
jgi:hypothetical protein